MSERLFENPVIRGEDHGDPFVIKYLDSFYLYHTGETSGRRGVSVHRSQNLVDWEFQGYALEAAETGWGWSDIWAPEVVYERGTFYMYVSGTSRRPGPATGRWDEGEGDDARRRLGLARAKTPLGPFEWDDAPLLDEWSIDGHPFRDDDGSMWLFYNIRTDETRVGAARGTGNVCDRLLGPDRLAGNPSPVTFPSQDWEGPYGDWYWNEGPYVLKRRGVYYQLYSGGFHRDASYAIGLARAHSPRGPWQKDQANPIFRSGERLVGPGHNSFVYGVDVSTQYAVYHAYVAGDEVRSVAIDRLFWAGDRPVISGPTEDPQPVPPRASLDPAIPHWRAEVWARGRWISIGGHRYGLSPDDAWHQVEVIQANDRVAVRIGGVLRSSRPAEPRGAQPVFECDGDLTAKTVSSFLEDGEIHELPAGSEYVWSWGGSGPVEIAVALRGDVQLALDGVVQEHPGDDGFELVRVFHDAPVGEIAVRAHADGAAVGDLFVYERPRRADA